jgi:hypothetical protein
LSAGHERGGLSDDARSDTAKHRLELIDVEVDPEAGNRFEFVQRAAGVPEPPAGHLRHDDAAGGRDRCQRDRHLVAHPAGAVFAHFDTGQIGQVHARAGSHHGIGEQSCFLSGHPTPHDRHEKCR